MTETLFCTSDELSGLAERDGWVMTPLFDAESGEPLGLFDEASVNYLGIKL